MSYYIFPQPNTQLFTNDDIAWLNEVILTSSFHLLAWLTMKFPNRVVKKECHW